MGGVQCTYTQMTTEMPAVMIDAPHGLTGTCLPRETSPYETSPFIPPMDLGNPVLQGNKLNLAPWRYALRGSFLDVVASLARWPDGQIWSLMATWPANHLQKHCLCYSL